MPDEANTIKPDGAASQQLDDIELTTHQKSPAAAAAPTKSLLADLMGGAGELPHVTVAYKDVTVNVKITKSATLPTVISPITDAISNLKTCCRERSTDFARIENASGVLRPGSMTLVLSPPGHGKTSLLKAISSRIELTSGKLYFNGRTPQEAEAEGVNVRKLTQYVDQVDAHLPLLTVFETLDFAHKVSSRFYNKDRVNAVIDMLGIEECRDTIIGNAMIRGISGGQRRRVSIGEMLVGDARAIFLDEFSNGLDTATSEDIGRGLRDWVKATQGSIISTLQQPTPGMLNLFDDVILIRDANIVFQGPVPDILPYLASMGFFCPDDVDVCDFIIDCLSQPRVTIANQRNAVKKSKKAQVVPSLESSLGFQITPAEVPCVTTETMVQHFKNSQFWKIIEKDIDAIFGEDKEKLKKEQPLLSSERSKQMYSLGYALPSHALFRLVVSRQWSLSTRDKAMFIPRVTQALFMGLLYGSLYYQSGDNNYFVRVAALVICIAQVAFGSMIELPASVQQNRIIYKQVSSKFFPSWMFVFANSISTIPFIFAQTVILGSFIYFMNGAAANGVNFIIFILLLLFQAVTLAVWFRMLSITSDNESTAQSIAGPSSGLLIVFAGLFLSPSATPDWLIWLYWLSPFSWSVRALAINEFSHSKYDALTSNGVRLGKLFLRQLDMKTNPAWIGYAFLYMFLLSFILASIHTRGLYRPFYELSIGTRRLNDEEIVPEEVDEEEDDEDAIEIAPKQGGMKREMSVSASEIVSRTSSFNDSALKTLREKLSSTPTWLSFRDVTYTVQVVKDGVKSDRILLNGISGYAEPGKLTALMGASGAGKTTLLDVLAGRKNSGVIGGSIKINGRVPTKIDISNTTGYVEQFDSLLAYDTVRETLSFAARLRLPADVSDETKMRIVDEILDILELTSIQDMIIGSSSMPGLSPSQLKRVNIGVELVANPAILFLDEPTTGLDSRAAQTVMRVVRRIARSGRAVICTIHQPSAELFYLFDRLVLLAAGGFQMYFGNLGHRSRRFVKYLSSIEGVKAIPPRYNPASWMLEELGVGVQSVKKAAAEAEGRTYETVEDMIVRFRESYFNSTVFEHHNKRLIALDTLGSGELEHAYEASRLEQPAQVGTEEEIKHNSESDFHTAGDEPKPAALQRQMSFSAYSKSAVLPSFEAGIVIKKPAPHRTQFVEVVCRHTRMYWRSSGLIYSRFLVVVLLSILYGLIFLQLEITNQATAISYAAAVVMANNSGSITFGATSLSKMMDDRVTFYRERSSGFYQGFYWGVGSLFAEIPWIALAAFVGQIPSYFLIGLRLDAGAYFLFTLALFMATLTYVCNSLFLSAVSPSPVMANVLQGVIFSLMFTFMGISITWPQIPAGYKWLYRAVPLSHLNAMLIMPQLETCDNLPYCGNIIDVLTPGSTEFTSEYSSKFLSEYLGWGFQSFWREFGYVWIYVGACLIIAFISTQFCDHSKR